MAERSRGRKNSSYKIREFQMIDVSPKFKTLRYARAEGTLFATPEIIEKNKK